MTNVSPSGIIVAQTAGSRIAPTMEVHMPWQRAPALSPLLIGAKEAARLLGISLASFYRQLSAGQIGPVPLSLGGRRLFRFSDLERFVRLGLPDRATWLALETQRQVT